MSHSHRPVLHLIKQLETQGRAPRKKESRPAWVTDLIDRLADAFDPFFEVARLGFECQPGESGWEIVLFLGGVEQMGGPSDGNVDHVDFRFDVQQLMRPFTSINQFQWYALPKGSGSTEPDQSSLVISGETAHGPVRIRVYAVPPEFADPGMRQFADGTVETT